MSTYLNMPDGQMVPIRGGLLLGRDAGCDIVIDDTKASRRHARLHVEGEVVEIEDLGSSNGTLLNGKPVQRRLLRDGDELQIGATRMVFRERAVQRPQASAVADDVDLFGGDEVPATAPPPPPASPPVSTAPPPRPAASPPPSPPGKSLVEFADEVVAVRATAPPPKGLPKGSAPALGRAAAGEPMIQQKQRTLQFAVTSERGAFGDDLAQMGGGMRMLVVVLVLAGAVGLAWLAMSLAG